VIRSRSMEVATKIKERPILFNSEMVRAVLDGRKTQTRRVCKHQDIDYSGLGSEEVFYLSPYGKPGDQLWVRETWGLGSMFQTMYKAGCNPGYKPVDGWKPSIHMHRYRSRIQLGVLDVRVERIQDISEDDARAEGINPDSPLYGDCGGYPWEGFTPAFRRLWNSINEKRGFGWDTNPWVWVIDFRMIKP